MKINAMVLVGKDASIGQGGTQPVMLKEDMRAFKHYTENTIVVAGRKTLKAIGCKLPNRTVLGLSSQANEELGEVAKYADHFFASVDELFDYLTEVDESSQVWVIGGGEVYSLLSPYISEFYVTIMSNYSNRKADTFLGGRCKGSIVSHMNKLGFAVKPNTTISVLDVDTKTNINYSTERMVFLNKGLS